ncbi:hypothetical protein GQ602_004624 [Ophiocordyceps camponoti-floridani]|uniref:Uncharacterized protein n=1 Tax=Ophiocordyceps camponoti-floridani TaxID=2030778 RepID=A0A8H4VDQ5_9HYPO|nr:hypothetical protein GQ602_004624 [Ophiocordyceps camponoti-floridani]
MLSPHLLSKEKADSPPRTRPPAPKPLRRPLRDLSPLPSSRSAPRNRHPVHHPGWSCSNGLSLTEGTPSAAERTLALVHDHEFGHLRIGPGPVAKAGREISPGLTGAETGGHGTCCR